MKATMFAPLLAVLAILFAAVEANAGYCGCARYCCCAPCCQMECHTVMKTVHCIEYEQQQFTCYKTCWDRVCEEHIVNCTKYVPETRTREECYTVCVPQWETKTCNYTVCKPCWETKTRDICYTVCKPCWETKTCCYTICKPCYETKTRDICYTVCKPCWETKTCNYTVCVPSWETKTRTYTTCKAVWEPKTRDICYTVCKPCWETKTCVLHGLRPVVGNQDPHLHNLQASLGNENPGNQLHGAEAGSIHEDDPGSERTLGNRSPTRFLARRTPAASASQAPGRMTPVRLLLLLLPRQVPHGMCPVPADQVLLQEVGFGVREQRDLLHAVRVRTLHEDLLLQGLPHGIRRAHLLLQGLPHGS